MKCRIKLIWDNEACVWVATSTDVPGLILEGGSLDSLIERFKVAVPELLELNGDASTVTLSYSDRREVSLA